MCASESHYARLSLSSVLPWTSPAAPRSAEEVWRNWFLRAYIGANALGARTGGVKGRSPWERSDLPNQPNHPKRHELSCDFLVS
jgi:hypothetical protein